MSDHRYESALAGDMIATWRAVFERQRAFAEHAFGQLSDEQFFAVLAPGLNSVAVITRHLGGNMLSRWVDFLTTDGEKESRDRDAELEPFPAEMTAEQRATERAQVMDLWSSGWSAAFAALDGLTNADLGRQVTIRGVPHAVHAAIARQLDHYAFHVGQINIIARQLVGTTSWKWFTLPPGTTSEFIARLRAKHDG
ncbi:MAG: DUF1572 family protein [Phycisphaerales bacterium JB037]